MTDLPGMEVVEEERCSRERLFSHQGRSRALAREDPRGTGPEI